MQKIRRVFVVKKALSWVAFKIYTLTLPEWRMQKTKKKQLISYSQG